MYHLPSKTDPGQGTRLTTGNADLITHAKTILGILLLLLLLLVAITNNAVAQTSSPNSAGPPTSQPYTETGIIPLFSPGYAGRGGSQEQQQHQTRTGDFMPLPDRWRIGFPSDYRHSQGAIYDPYNQNVLKGDYPIIGQDTFLNLTLTSDTLVEARKTPVPSGVSASNPGAFNFFGQGDSTIVTQNVIVSAELFQGDASFRPRDWELRATLVGNVNYVHTNEANVVNPNPAEGRDRFDENVGPQELFVEKHLADLTANYDFISARAGIQGFNSDFRGFLFSDNEPGIRFFGNLDSNRTQWNVALFNQLEKDTNSGLNTFNWRDQQIALANVYEQDFLWPGYTAQLSFHTNIDSSGGYTYDNNGVLVRPAPVGTPLPKQVKAYYIGWAGDGHIGRFNLSHQFYQALGSESFNPIAGQHVSINAQFAAVELSYDRDWMRYRASFIYASGDHNPQDGHANGFDSIFDNPNFAGGPFSYFTRQAVRLTGSGVNLVNRNSFLPDLRTSKEQGQANFVNPGLFLYNLGADFDLTPKLSLITNISYLQFDDTHSIQLILQDNKIPRDIGLDYGIGVRYRPFLNNNAIITIGASALTPGAGFKAIYNSQTLYSTFFSATLTY